MQVDQRTIRARARYLAYLTALAAACGVPPSLAFECDPSALLGPEERVAVGDAPRGIAIGDVDLDGDLDVAVANATSDDVSVLLNRGDATFAPEQRYPVGTDPFDIALGDLDGNGSLDIAVTNYFSNDVGVLLNRGDGTFAEQVTYEAGSLPYGIALGDVDGDGALDSVSTNLFGNDVTVLINEGDGTFEPQFTESVASRPTGVALGDLDGDETLDIGTVSLSDDASVLLNEGGGAFAPAEIYPVGDGPIGIAIGDLDGDCAPDIVTGNPGENPDPGDVSVLVNLGGGVFADDLRFPAGTDPSTVAIGDLDNDADADVVTTNEGSDDLSVLLNDGDGTFSPPVTFPVGDTPRGVDVGDLNADGRLDVVSGNAGGDTISVLLGACGDGSGANPLPSGRIPDAPGPQGMPLIVTKQEGGAIRLAWSASCSDADADYAIYTASLSHPEDLRALTCSTGGALEAVVTPCPGQELFLVVPQGSDAEGSYGVDSSGEQRAPAAIPCHSRALAECATGG
jgi:hypothetical protein